MNSMEILVWILSALCAVVFLGLTVWVVHGILKAPQRRPQEPPPNDPMDWLHEQIERALEDQNLVREARIQVRNSKSNEA